MSECGLCDLGYLVDDVVEEFGWDRVPHARVLKEACCGDAVGGVAACPPADEGVVLAGDDQGRRGDRLQARVGVGAAGGELSLGGGLVAGVASVAGLGGLSGPLVGEGVGR